MNNNNTTPAMKEVETVEQAAERLTISYYKPSNINSPAREYNFYKGFIAGAQWREENPVRIRPDLKDENDALYLKINELEQMLAENALPPTPKQDKEWVITHHGVAHHSEGKSAINQPENVVTNNVVDIEQVCQIIRNYGACSFLDLSALTTQIRNLLTK